MRNHASEQTTCQAVPTRRRDAETHTLGSLVTAFNNVAMNLQILSWFVHKGWPNRGVSKEVNNTAQMHQSIPIAESSDFILHCSTSMVFYTTVQHMKIRCNGGGGGNTNTYSTSQIITQCLLSAHTSCGEIHTAHEYRFSSLSLVTVIPLPHRIKHPPRDASSSTPLVSGQVAKWHRQETSL